MARVLARVLARALACVLARVLACALAFAGVCGGVVGIAPAFGGTGGGVISPFGGLKFDEAPAAFCRKAITSSEHFEMWGDGKQTRSFTYIDDCVEGVLRLMFSDCDVPINLGSTEMVDMIEFANIAMSFEDKKLPIKHIDGPMGVRGRNSNNKLIREKLGWEPTIKIADGLRKTYFWIKGEIEKEGGDASAYSKSEIVQQVDDSLMQLGKEKSTAIDESA